jgi:ABC-type antimicrobial peptide transport system permease subunit
MLDFALKEIRKRSKRYLLNVLVIGLVVVLIIVLNSMGTAYKDASKLPFQEIRSNIIVQRNGNVPENTSGAVCSCSLAPIRYGYVTNISKVEGVTDVSYGLLLWVFDQDHFKRVFGVNYNDTYGKNLNARLVEGVMPRADTDALVDRDYAEQYHLSTNQIITAGGKNYTITGIIKNAGKELISSDIYVNLDSARDLAYNSKNLQAAEPFEKNDVNVIFVGAEQTKVADVSKYVNEILNKTGAIGGKTPTGQVTGKFSVFTPESFESQISSVLLISDQMIAVILLATIVGALLIVIKSMSYVVMQRRREFGIMKAIGFTKRDIQKEIVVETSIQMSFGFVLGVILSLLAIFGLSRTTISLTIPWELNPYPHFLAANPDMASTVQVFSLPIQFQAMYALIALAVVFFVGLLTVVVLTRLINRLKPAEMLSHE